MNDTKEWKEGEDIAEELVKKVKKELGNMEWKKGNKKSFENSEIHSIEFIENDSAKVIINFNIKGRLLSLTFKGLKKEKLYN